MSQNKSNNRAPPRTCTNGGRCTDPGWRKPSHAQASEWHTHCTVNVERCSPTVAGGLLGNRLHELNTVARALPHRAEN